jgi:hypothetical protein
LTEGNLGKVFLTPAPSYPRKHLDTLSRDATTGSICPTQVRGSLAGKILRLANVADDLALDLRWQKSYWITPFDAPDRLQQRDRDLALDRALGQEEKRGQPRLLTDEQKIAYFWPDCPTVA